MVLKEGTKIEFGCSSIIQLQTSNETLDLRQMIKHKHLHNYEQVEMNKLHKEKARFESYKCVSPAIWNKTTTVTIEFYNIMEINNNLPIPIPKKQRKLNKRK